MTNDVDRVLDFWFNRNPIEWIIAPDGLDDEIRSQFGDLVQQARENKLDAWQAGPRGSLALVVLLNQLTRNLFRDTVEAFSGDDKAFNIATQALARDFDKQITVIQTSALIMAFMHRESLISLVAARSLFKALKERCESEDEHKWIDLAISASQRHLNQVVRFGRFPARNKLLERETTEEEQAFLDEENPGARIAAFKNEVDQVGIENRAERGYKA